MEPTTNLPAPLVPNTAGDIVPTSEDIVAAFLDRLKVTTARAYDGDLRDFARHLGKSSPREAIAELLGHGGGYANRIALGYRRGLESRALSPATVARRLSALRSVVELARSHGAVEWSLAVPGPRVQSYRDVRGPGRAGWRAMVDEARRRKDSKGLRDLALVRVLHDLMLRRSEAVGLDLEHVEREAGKAIGIWILGKGRSDREYLRLAPATAGALEGWLVARGPAPGPVFTRLDRPGPAGQPANLQRLSDRSVARVVGDLGAAAGVNRPVRPHGLRHEGVTRAIELGEPLLDVQLAARHADPRTTQRYVDRVRNPQPRISESISRD